MLKTETGGYLRRLHTYGSKERVVSIELRWKNCGVVSLNDLHPQASTPCAGLGLYRSDRCPKSECDYLNGC